MEKIVFYDGECGLCQRSISYLSKIDQKKELQFAPLNGETYKKYFNDESDLKTVVFFYNKKITIKSEAFIEIFAALGGVKKLFVIFKIIPSFIRNFFYDLIASHRKKVSCIILTKDERFLK